MNNFNDGKKGGKPGFRILQPGEQIQVNLKNAEPRICECGCKYWEPVILAFRISPLASPTGQELLAQQPVLRCADCKKVLAMGEGHAQIKQ